MDDFGKMLEIVKRVEGKIDEAEERLNGLYHELKGDLNGVSRWRWRIEGALFLASGVLSAAVAVIVEMLHK